MHTVSYHFKAVVELHVKIKLSFLLQVSLKRFQDHNKNLIKDTLISKQMLILFCSMVVYRQI